MHDNGGLRVAARLKGFEMPWVFVFPAIVIGISILLPFLAQILAGLLVLIGKAIAAFIYFLTWLRVKWYARREEQD